MNTSQINDSWQRERKKKYQGRLQKGGEGALCLKCFLTPAPWRQGKKRYKANMAKILKSDKVGK